MQGDQLRSLVVCVCGGGGGGECKKKTKHSKNNFVGKSKKNTGKKKPNKQKSKQAPRTAGCIWRPASWQPGREKPSLPGARWSCSWRRSQDGDCRSGWKGANGSRQACRQVRCKKIRRIRSEFGKQIVPAVGASQEDTPLPGGGRVCVLGDVWIPHPGNVVPRRPGSCELPRSSQGCKERGRAKPPPHPTFRSSPLLTMWKHLPVFLSLGLQLHLDSFFPWG